MPRNRLLKERRRGLSRRGRSTLGKSFVDHLIRREEIIGERGEKNPWWR